MGTGIAAALASSAAAQTDDVISRLRQGQQLRAHNRFTEARKVYRDLLRDVREHSPNRRLEGLVLDNLGRDEQDRGDYAAAETAYNHGLAAVQGLSADDSVPVALKTHLAELYIAENRAEDAEPILRQSLAVLRSSTTRDLVALSEASEDLAVVCILRKKFAESEQLLREAQALIESAGGGDDRRLASSLLTYAGLLGAEHHHSEAIVPAERAWQILSSNPSDVQTPYLASALSVLAVVYYSAGRLEDAEASAQKCVEMAEASLGTRHPRLVLYYTNYAGILKLAGRKNEAKAFRKKAEEIMEQNPSSGTGGYTVNVASLR
jgi:tetratricopeptide (TPR) repeat protein